jgi:hypothetical protein
MVLDTLIRPDALRLYTAKNSKIKLYMGVMARKTLKICGNAGIIV